MNDDWFEGDGRTDAERRFIAALREHARSWGRLGVRPVDTQAWTDREVLYVHVDLVDRALRQIVGTVIVELDGERVRGYWGALELVGEPDIPRHDRFDSPPLDTPEEAARHAAAWLEAQLRRPIECREWRQGSTLTRRQWHLADTGRALVAAGPGLPACDPDGPWLRRQGPPPGEVPVILVRPPQSS